MPLPADAPAGLCPQCLLKSNPLTPPHTVVVTGAPPSTHRLVPIPGQTFGDYRILRLLGHGGMGEVYECEHIPSGRRVALKVMSHALASDDDRKRFLREGRLAASVNHPNVVYVHGSEEIDGMPAIAMELARGGTLHDRLKRQGPLSISDAVAAVLQMIDGLEAAHSAGVLHRDIKPANCFITPEGTVKIGDFGLSVSTLARGESLLTAAGSVMGTPAYASPEQLRGEELDVRSDIYSVGATLYHLLTGKTPYSATEFVKLITEVLEKQPAAPNALRKDIPAELNRVVLRCLAKDRASRFQDYEELRDALLPFRVAERVPANPARRVVAGIIDDLFAFGPSFLFLTYWSFDPMDHFVRERTTTAGLVWLAFYGWYVAYYAFSEGLWGCALGKTICGLRLVGPSGHAPGIPRALLRAAIYVLPMVLPSLLYFMLVSKADMRAALARGDTLITDWIWWPTFALLFLTMRRRNGFAAIHDLLSGTRVIVRPRTQRRPPARAVEKPIADGRGSVGPYEVRGSLWKTEQEELLLGFDPGLRRNVWIHLRPLTSAPLDQARRELSRPARLRWLNAGQTESRRWEAYEAPTGGPMSKAPWSSVRFWLLDVAEELRVALDDPKTAPPLSLDHLWVTASGRALFVDFPLPAQTKPLDINASQSFLAQVAETTLDPTSPVPPDATGFIGALKRHAFDRPEFVVGNLSSLTSKPAEITRGWRAMSLLMLPAFFMLLGIFGAGMFNFENIRWERAWKSLHPDRPHFLHAAQSYLGLAEENDERDMELARAYLVSHFSDVITNEAFWSNADLVSSLGTDERKLLRDAVARPAPETSIVQEAERVVPRWIAKEDRKARRISIGIVIGVLIFGIVCIGAVELIAVAFRRSFVLNLFGIAVIDAHGKLATRMRLLGRWAVGALPMLAFAALGMSVLEEDGTLAFLGMASSILGICVSVLVAGVIAYAIRNPSRGVADRIARTYLVPK